MSEYYLISQLPGLDGLDGLDGRSALPIKVSEFKEVCSRFLENKSLEILNGLTIVPEKEDKKTGSSLVDEWNRQERELRMALGKVRAARMNKSFDTGDIAISAVTQQAAKTAAEMKDPLEAELFLNGFRLELLNKLRPIDGFSEDAVYFYGLKLMLLERIQKFDKNKGIATYQKIYNSILNGDNQES